MDLGLQGKVALVAGASSGLGLAVAQRLVREGCQVALLSRNESRIEQAAQQVREATGGKPRAVLPLVADVTDEEAIIVACQETVAYFGGLHILVTNAGGPPAGYIADFDADAWRKALELNLLSTINLCRHAVPHLRKAAQEGLARIIMITSISAKQPIPNLYLSNTARAGVQGFAKSLAEELGPEGITVNTVLPGFTRTKRLQELALSAHERTGQPIEEIEAGWADACALKRIGTPDEFAATVAFLASQWGGYISGVGLPIDGGRSKHLL